MSFNSWTSIHFSLFVGFRFLTLQISFLFVGFRFLTLQISFHFVGFRFLTLQISFHFVGFRFLTLQISLDFVFVSFRFFSFLSLPVPLPKSACLSEIVIRVPVHWLALFYFILSFPQHTVLTIIHYSCTFQHLSCSFVVQ